MFYLGFTTVLFVDNSYFANIFFNEYCTLGNNYERYEQEPFYTNNLITNENIDKNTTTPD